MTKEEWLARWDAGEEVQSVSMGGISEDYEQCIQNMGAEILRMLIEDGREIQSLERPVWQELVESIDKRLFAMPEIEALGVSGAQHGAAFNLAIVLYRRGPDKAFADPVVKDRLITVSKKTPLETARL